jgi:putative transposase
MTKRRNDNTHGDAHELTFSCYQSKKLLSSERVCRWFLENLDQARRKHNFAVWAYVLMPEHAHLLIWPRAAPYDISQIRRAIKSPVAQQVIDYASANHSSWLPNLTRTRGGKIEMLFWQSGGGYDRNVNDCATLMKMVDYIHLNPVRRGLVERASDWPWSSAAAFEGVESPLKPDPIDPAWLDGVD